MKTNEIIEKIMAEGVEKDIVKEVPEENPVDVPAMEVVQQ